ncbi:hypothetical protein F2P81_014853 [Scophthalmus maximus]|uniref:Uncharacterized protein n=1 Tax=Scophthalmus maximus TaxID=52904 RepID=A0A6A4SEH7_SCOMX|nr:hypothetical protein F2P81_014853 [Scophthalmus maximus]
MTDQSDDVKTPVHSKLRLCLTSQFQLTLSLCWTEQCLFRERGQICMSRADSVKPRGCVPLRHECGKGPPPQLRVL